VSAINIQRFSDQAARANPIPLRGKVTEVVGLTIEATGPPMRIGDLCYIQPPESTVRLPVEVVGFRRDRILLMALGRLDGIAPESLLIPTYAPIQVKVGPHLIGRVIGGLGQPLDQGPPLNEGEAVPLQARPPAPLERRRILEPITTGVRAIDACMTCGTGQRLGIMSGSGVGKSKLIGMIARNTNADVNVIALIGERGREVRDFVEADLGEDGLKRSIVVAATSDEPALVRIKGAYLATAIAEWYRKQGANVMLVMDSVTRFAMAQREVGLAVGEPPTTKGYPPSVYAVLPQLLERAGTSAEGSITGFYSVLVEGDDMNDPIGDAVRSILDGHVVLSRDLASSGHYPAIDVLESVSRTMIDVTTESHQAAAQALRATLATYRDAEDLVNIGAYVAGSNPEIDRALRVMPNIRAFLRQGLFEPSKLEDMEPQMRRVLA
jgi:flagellum-specific ATP synthase